MAEIEPVQVQPGQTTRFTYKLLPRFEEEEPGFDRVEVATPVQAISLDALRIDGLEEAFAVERLDETGFAVQIPRVDAQRTEELIEIDFRAQVFQYGTIFSGQVNDSTRPYEVSQPVVPGDADAQSDSETLQVVLTDIRQKPIGQVELSSPVCTPNGDGVNDLLHIEHHLLNLEGAVPVRIDLYNLSGRKQRTINRTEGASGRFRVAWDGRDDGGSLLPPGVYLLRLEVDTGEGRDQVGRVVALAY